MIKDVFDSHRNNTIIILVLVALFISVIYFPKSIWEYEAELKDESHFRMQTINLAEKLHYQLAKSYTTDTEALLAVVNGVRDSILLAENDTSYDYYGNQRVALPGKTIPVNYSDDYIDYYNELHLQLFKLLEPNHFMDANSVDHILDTIKTLFDAGNYIGEQTLELDSVSLSFNVSDKYHILYQNINTSMFNALTNSYTKYPNFSNPLVNAVMDSIGLNPELSGRVDFTGVYDSPVRVDFIIPFTFEENLEKTRLALKKHFVIDSYDSATYGDTLYEMALSEFLVQNDTLEFMPESLTLMYTDTSSEKIAIPVGVKFEDMEAALTKRRNTLYTMLTGYSEPSAHIAKEIIKVALDSLASAGVGIDSIHYDIDLTDAVFSINMHNNILDYFNKVSLDQAYYKTAVNLSNLDWNKAAVEVVEFVAATLKKKSDFKNWQIVEAETDTFNINIFEDFMRVYDDMNLKLYEKLTGKFTNIHNYAFEVLSLAGHFAGIDSLAWSGEQELVMAPDTIPVNVFITFMAEYDTTFTIMRDTVAQLNDSTFSGVWYRHKLGVTQEFSLDSLEFLSLGDNSKYIYDFGGTDSVRSINIIEKSDTARVEKVYFGMDTYILTFSDDSLMENLYRITDEFSIYDSIQIDSLNVVSDEFVVDDKEKDLFMSKDSFGGWQDTLISKKYEKIQLFSHYLFNPEHTRCSVTDIPFRVTVRNNVNLSIESPITSPIKTNRYLFFSQIDSSHGSIHDGEESWAE
ncbi:hypothetical protein HQ531_09805 [bacterium]|nr:hypothetical protein [bacterium]